jgi:electron transfer flavoprotein alpha subunit
LTENKGLWVFSENIDLASEMLGKGRELADKLHTELAAVIIGNNVKETADAFVRCGADKVYMLENPELKRFQPETYLSALHDLLVNHKPEILLIGSTRNGKPLAARLAMRLETGCVPDCIGLDVDDQARLLCQRITYGGNAIAKLTFNTKPQIATVPARAFDKPEPKDRNGQLIKLDLKIETPSVEVMETKPIETSNVRIEDADVIISCGRGLEKKEDVSILDDVSKLLSGQVGCSRPLSEDRKWFSEWVGLSGHKVRPKLYIACGISGVIQHVAGIRDAKIIVAINKDPEAPIFEIADYGVVGNLYEVLPALKEALQKQLQ